MFTGIVQALGSIVAAAATPAGKRLTVALAELSSAPISHGDSVCVSGVCLTAVNIAQGHVDFDVITETLRRTTLGEKIVGTGVNLELSLRGDSFVGGHFVQGHIDAVAKIVAVQSNPSDWRITFEAPSEMAAYLIPKGSITVDGVSMTIAEASGTRFTLAVIPTTLQKTTLGTLRLGDRVNMESDILARTVVHYLRNIQGQPAPAPTLTREKLQELGMA